jgi:hypothetical protein
VKCVSRNRTPVMFAKIMVVLQNCMDLLKVVPGSYSETCPASYDMKVDEVTDIQEEEDPLLTFPVVKAEYEVSCVSVSIVRHILQIYKISVFLFICLSVSASNTSTLVHRF